MPGNDEVSEPEDVLMSDHDLSDHDKIPSGDDTGPCLLD